MAVFQPIVENACMETISQIIQPVKRYLVETILLGVSTLVVIASIVMYMVNVSVSSEKSKTTVQYPRDETRSSSSESSQTKMMVDMTGAVLKPDSYELPTNARLKDLLKKAGGLTELADKDFFYRNFNLAEILSDQEKIYVPSILEVSTGIFKENYKIIDLVTASNNSSPKQEETSAESSKIHINSATAEELDSLPGVGATTAQKIIDNRPYLKPDDIVTKKIIGTAAFAKIKDSIDL